MKIKIVCVGRLKEKYLVAGMQEQFKRILSRLEYLKGLQAYCKVEVYEVADESIPDNCSLANETLIKAKEGRKMLDKIKQDDYVILLDVSGTQIDSVELSNKMEKAMISGKSTIAFVIGGSLGHGEEMLDRANFRLSFSKMTLPHQLMRLVLVEQIYRAFKIMKNETYHK